MATTLEKPFAVSTPMPGELSVMVRSMATSGTMKWVDIESTKAHLVVPAPGGARRRGGGMSALRACTRAQRPYPKD